jgi:hypothetical protein
MRSVHPPRLSLRDLAPAAAAPLDKPLPRQATTKTAPTSPRACARSARRVRPANERNAGDRRVRGAGDHRRSERRARGPRRCRRPPRRAPHPRRARSRRWTRVPRQLVHRKIADSSSENGCRCRFFGFFGRKPRDQLRTPAARGRAGGRPRGGEELPLPLPPPAAVTSSPTWSPPPPAAASDREPRDRAMAAPGCGATPW